MPRQHHLYTITPNLIVTVYLMSIGCCGIMLHMDIQHRHTDTHTDTHTHAAQPHTQTQTYRYRDTDTHTHIQTYRYTNTQAETYKKHTHMDACTHIDGPTDIQLTSNTYTP